MLNKETICPSVKCNNGKARRMLSEEARCPNAKCNNGKAKRKANEVVKKKLERSHMS